jgi:hypothetical protein
MKITIFFLLGALLAFGCHKGASDITPSTRRIAYLSGVGDLPWNGGTLESVAGFRLSYSGGRLAILRREKHDTTVTVTGSDTDTQFDYALVRYSVEWENGKIHAVNLDTSYAIVTSPPKLGPGGLNPGGLLSESFASGGRAFTYFYTGNRLDSAMHAETVPGSYVVIYDRYDGAGNVLTETAYHYPYSGSLIFGTLPPGSQFPLPTESVTTFTYDDHPNPWGMLLTRTGMVLPGMETHNFSRNNPLTAEIDLTPGMATGGLHQTVSWQYEYDSQGYPVTITSSATNDVVRVRYQ